MNTPSPQITACAFALVLHVSRVLTPHTVISTLPQKTNCATPSLLLHAYNDCLPRIESACQHSGVQVSSTIRRSTYSPRRSTSGNATSSSENLGIRVPTLSLLVRIAAYSARPTQNQTICQSVFLHNFPPKMRWVVQLSRVKGLVPKAQFEVLIDNPFFVNRDFC